jgi:hypothetical protein
LGLNAGKIQKYDRQEEADRNERPSLECGCLDHGKDRLDEARVGQPAAGDPCCNAANPGKMILLGASTRADAPADTLSITGRLFFVPRLGNLTHDPHPRRTRSARRRSPGKVSQEATAHPTALKQPIVQEKPEPETFIRPNPGGSP